MTADAVLPLAFFGFLSVVAICMTIFAIKDKK